MVFTALVAYVGHLSGYLVHFHCRSGKDRTGVLDAEIKTLAMLRAIHGSELNFDNFRQGEITQELRNWLQIVGESAVMSS